ncbi:hypothetical protein XENTR_v10012809 [Xenopus tropicalis]|uniref:Uncharacterized protein LOC100485975 n=1 Tax=Xenopus tropicalis TaxID=8364 RepID=A0A8J1JK75_XENTR|nr:uncharacterized protein LOC100485975 [Xenopus tropicalis]XP_031757041.1 uncharacterized protein LOC100485975 [Xenopus tropicalis]KAE8612314.1 hypothetical protein XENTR_v10012809 [Xenopus tropicalis]|eukprot:XP_002933102.1 PREDICTED: uncharacterized protein LOC100485975 [Xenopus tropicalis]
MRDGDQVSMTAASSRCFNGAITELLDEKGKRSALPVIKKEPGRGAVTKSQNPSRLAEHSPARRSSQKRMNSKAEQLSMGEISPWVSQSPSESSLSAYLSSIPSLRACSENITDPPKSAWGTETNLHTETSSPQTPLPAQPSGQKDTKQPKQRPRTNAIKRRFQNKIHSTRLPPVPPVSELSFSRNFSFSFFELPRYQSPQHWLQRQKTVYLVMKQLH